MGFSHGNQHLLAIKGYPQWRAGKAQIRPCPIPLHQAQSLCASTTSVDCPNPASSYPPVPPRVSIHLANRRSISRSSMNATLKSPNTTYGSGKTGFDGEHHGFHGCSWCLGPMEVIILPCVPHGNGYGTMETDWKSDLALDLPVENLKKIQKFTDSCSHSSDSKPRRIWLLGKKLSWPETQSSLSSASSGLAFARCEDVPLYSKII